MARHGQRLIVFLGRHLHDDRAERLPELFEQIEIFGPGVLRGRENGHAALEQVGRGIGGAGLLAAGQGMAAQEAAAAGQPAVERRDDRLLRAAGVGDQRPLGAMLGGLANVLDDLADRRADDDQFGLGHALVQVDRGVGDGPDAAGDPQTGLAAADADDVFRQIPLAQRQADRPADQSDPHNGDRIPLFHGVFRVGGDHRRSALQTNDLLYQIAAGLEWGGQEPRRTPLPPRHIEAIPFRGYPDGELVGTPSSTKLLGGNES